VEKLIERVEALAGGDPPGVEDLVQAAQKKATNNLAPIKEEIQTEEAPLGALSPGPEAAPSPLMVASTQGPLESLKGSEPFTEGVSPSPRSTLTLEKPTATPMTLIKSVREWFLAKENAPTSWQSTYQNVGRDGKIPGVRYENTSLLLHIAEVRKMARAWAAQKQPKTPI
jgi:hypothetical protein